MLVLAEEMVVVLVSEVLVSRLLARLSEIEKEALSISAGRFVEGMAGRRVDPDLNRYLDTVADPDAVIQLCRAHRDLIDMYESAVIGEKRKRDSGWHAEAQRHAIGRAQGLLAAVQLVARGLGVEETTGE